MKFVVRKSSDWYYKEEEVEINTLEELQDFQLKSEHSLIINFKVKLIEIYDGYRE